MKTALSGLMLALVLSHAAFGQAIPKPLVRNMRAAPANDRPAFEFEEVRSDSSAHPRSHAVRNGVIAGAVLGAVAGGVGATYLPYGCDLLIIEPGGATKPCHPRADENRAIVGLSFVGAAVGTATGAIIGGIWDFFERATRQ